MAAVRHDRRRGGGSASTAIVDVAAVAEERVDAVTAEPLVPDRFVEIVSPDGTLRLFYNTSTLIRIALDHGGFLQPPHFREAMTASLQRRIEQLEGRRFHFAAVDERAAGARGPRRVVVVGGDAAPHHNDGDDGDYDNAVTSSSASTTLRAAEAGDVLHRHVYFEQIISQFYFLSPAEVYVCPVCYAHYVATRYVPSLRARGRRVDYVDDGQTAVVDPLDVLTHMQHTSPPARTARAHHHDGGDDDNDSSDNNNNNNGNNSGDEDDEVAMASRSILVCIVFRRAQQWRRHMRVHHAVHAVSSNDYRLRDVLCSYHNAYNQLHEAAYATRMAALGEAKRRPALTQQRYWQLNARYNVLRYNRVVAALERAERDTTSSSSYMDACGFDGEDMSANSFTAAADVGDDDDDFINDDDDDDDDDDSSSSASSTSSSSDVVDSDASSDDDGIAECRRGSVGGRAAQRPTRRRARSSSSSSSSDSSSDVSDSDDAERSPRDVDAMHTPPTAAAQTATTLYKQGVLAPTPPYLQRLSAEDRAFVERAAQRRVAPSQLYDPVMHRASSRHRPHPHVDNNVDEMAPTGRPPPPSTLDEDDGVVDDVDWSNIGDTLTTPPVTTAAGGTLKRGSVATTTAPSMAARAAVTRMPATPSPSATTTMTTLLLLDDASDADAAVAPPAVSPTARVCACARATTAAAATHTARLLVDDDDDDDG